MSTEAIIQSIDQDSNRAENHLILGLLEYHRNNTIESLLSLHYFLMLKPNSERSEMVLDLVQKITRNLDPDEFILTQAGAPIMGQIENGIFIENTAEFFKTLGVKKNEERLHSRWRNYIDFFNNIAISNHMNTYGYYISQSSYSGATAWLGDNNDKLKEFKMWMKQNKF